MPVTSMRARWCHREPGGARSTRWRKWPAPRRMCHSVVGRRSLPRHRSALWQGAQNSALGTHASRFARHTNTDSVRRVRPSAEECGTAVPRGMLGTPATPQPRQGRATGCAWQRRAPWGPGAHRQRNGTESSGHSRPKPLGRASQAREGGSTPPPPPSQEGMHAAAGHHSAWTGRDGGDTTLTHQRF